MQRFRDASRAFAACALLCGAGCAPSGVLDLSVVTTSGSDPLAGAEQLRLVVSEPKSEQRRAVVAGAIDIDLGVEVGGAVGVVTMEAYRGSVMTARGETPPLALHPEDRAINLLVGRAGAFGTLGGSLPAGSERQQSVLLSAYGVVLVGGMTETQAMSTRAFRYDFFMHQLEGIADLPEPRSGGILANCGARCALLALGESAPGKLATSMLQFDGERWTPADDGLSPWDRRSGASAVRLSDGRYVIAGGRCGAVACKTILLLKPATESGDPKLSVLPVQLSLPMDDVALADVDGSVVIAGGESATKKSAIEVLHVPSMTLHTAILGDGTAVPVGAHGAAAVGGGQAVVIGGLLPDGKRSRSAWFVDTTTLAVRRVDGVLSAERSGHRVMVLGQQLLVIGGSRDGGLTADVELLALPTLAPVKTIPLGVPRTGFSAEQLGRGSLLIVGGRSATGLPTVLEVYETADPVTL